MTALVGIVIPVHNTGAYLEDCLRSVTAQTIPVDCCVVDDGSTDDTTLSILSRWRSEPVRIITHPERRGVSAARNSAIVSLDTPFILPVDSDDRIAPTYAEKALERIQSDPAIAIVGCRIERFGTSSQLVDLPNIASGLRDFIYGNPLPAVSLFRRADWEAIGGYTEGTRWGEDWELWLRILALGGSVSLIDEPLYEYRQHPGQTTDRLESGYKIEDQLAIVRRNRSLFAPYVDMIWEDRLTDALVLASFKRRYGRLNDFLNSARARLHATARLLRRS